HFAGSMLADQRVDALEDRLQPLRKILRVEHLQCIVEDMPAAAAGIRVDDAYTGALRAGVDAQDSDHRLSPMIRIPGFGIRDSGFARAARGENSARLPTNLPMAR